MRLIEIHIEVAELERALTFYRALLPHARVTRWQDGSAAAVVLSDGVASGLWRAGKFGVQGGRGGAHVHFAFQIASSQYDSFLSRLRELGCEPNEHVWDDGERSIYFLDPDGHQGEFMTKDWLGRRTLPT